MAQLVPITSAPNQIIRQSLLVDGGTITLLLTLSWNGTGGFWLMSIANASGNSLVSDVPLLTGVWPAANILAPYVYLRIGSAFVVHQSGSADDWPNDSTLGSEWLLLWDDTPPS